MKVLNCVAAAAMLLITNAASASILVASDNFQQANLGSIKNQTSGTGWGGEWLTDPNFANSPQVVVPTVTLGGGNALQFSKNSDGAAYRMLNTSVTGDVLVDFLIQYGGDTLGNTLGDNDFLGLWFGSATGPNIGLKANCGTGSCANDAFVRLSGASGPFLNNSDLLPNVTYHLFGHLYKTGSSVNYNRFDAWINPTDLEMSTLTGYDASFAGNSGVSSFDKIGFRTANLDNNVTVRIDDLNIAVVPEPSSVALFGLALMGLAGIRRGKRS